MIFSRMKPPIGLPFVDPIFRHRLGAGPEIDKILIEGRKSLHPVRPQSKHNDPPD